MSTLGVRSPFREGASPEGQVRESLDERVPVVRGPAWLGLALAALAILGVVVWAAASRVEVAVSGTGVVMSAPPVERVQSPVDGSVLEVGVRPGSAVRPGQLLVRVRGAAGAVTAVRASVAATTVDATVTPGGVVSTGTTLVRLEPRTAVRRAYLYVPLDDASGLRAGQEALVTRAGPQQQQESLLRGQVLDVTSAPATPERLVQVLGPTLGPRAVAGPPVVEVLVDLGTTSATPPALGTALSGRIVVSRQSPFQLAL